MRRRRRSFAITLGCFVLALTAGCVVENISTEIRVRDPHAVTVRDARGSVLIAPGTTPATTPLGTRTMPATGDFQSNTYTVQLEREDDGSLMLARIGPSSAPIEPGRFVLPADGLLTLDGADSDWGFRARLGDPSLVLRWCTRPLPLRRRRGFWVSNLPRECPAVTGSDTLGLHTIEPVYYALDIPWTEVTQMRERHAPDRVMATVVMVWSTLFFGFVSALCGIHGNTTSYGFMTGFIATGIGLDLAFLPTLFAHEHSVDLRP